MYAQKAHKKANNEEKSGQPQNPKRGRCICLLCLFHLYLFGGLWEWVRDTDILVICVSFVLLHVGDILY